MVKIEEGTKLDFSDVLIKPKRSTIKSRSEVDLNRTFTTLHSKRVWYGVPIMVANMDTTGTFQMFLEGQKHNIITCIHKHYNEIDWIKFVNDNSNALYFKELSNKNEINFDYLCISSGISDFDFNKTKTILNKIPQIYMIMLDVANGYTEHFIECVKKFRKEFPNKVIIAGNVVTAEMTEQLLLAGADIIKVGIGPGCLESSSKILMANGTYKNISDIKEGEYVINKNGDSKKVLNVINNGMKYVNKLTTNNWHEDTFITDNHSLLIGDLSTSSEKSISSSGIAKLLDKNTRTGETKYKWKLLDDIDENKQFLLMPKQYNWKLEENFKIDLGNYIDYIKGRFCATYIETTNEKKTVFNRFLESTYDLGYIFGMFLGNETHHLIINKNTNSEAGQTSWNLNKNRPDIIEKLYNSILNILNYKCSVVDKDNSKKIVCYNKCLTKLFLEFGKKTDKHLPEKYYCKNIDYIQGLYDGLIDSNGTKEKYANNTVFKFDNTSKSNIELFYWCCLNLNISFSSSNRGKNIGNLKGVNKDNLNECFSIKTHTTNRFTKDFAYSYVKQNSKTRELVETYDLEIDCETHSFIANNTIVHNSVCTTRKQTGVGFPQLSAVMECADAAHGIGGHIISDGGCTVPGDFSKAFGAGADFIMAGGYFAGHTESGGDLVEENGKQFFLFYGMSSDTAMNKHAGGVANYRSSEGKTVKIAYKGDVKNTLLDLLGGIRSTLTYVGAKTLKELSKRTTFIRVNNQLNNIYK